MLFEELLLLIAFISKLIFFFRAVFCLLTVFKHSMLVVNNWWQTCLCNKINSKCILHRSGNALPTFVPTLWKTIITRSSWHLTNILLVKSSKFYHSFIPLSLSRLHKSTYGLSIIFSIVPSYSLFLNLSFFLSISQFFLFRCNCVGDVANRFSTFQSTFE